MKLIFVLLISLCFFEIGFSQNKFDQIDSITTKFFKEKVFSCKCLNDKTSKRLTIKEEEVLLNGLLVLQITIEGLSKMPDTIFLSKEGNKIIFHDFSSKEVKSKVFIDFDEDFNNPTVFWSSTVFGVGSYLMKSESIEEDSYLISATFEGITVDSRLIYQVDFNKDKEVYRFYYFDGIKGYVCQ